jgi:hypothetical protein
MAPVLEEARICPSALEDSLAECRRFDCDGCGRNAEAWSDGNPYYLDEHGTKRYAYHPDHENLARCVGNDEPHLCLQCGVESNVDSRQRRSNCPACDADRLVPLWDLAGKRCPSCPRGRFVLDPNPGAIS